MKKRFIDISLISLRYSFLYMKDRGFNLKGSFSHYLWPSGEWGIEEAAWGKGQVALAKQTGGAVYVLNSACTHGIVNYLRSLPT